MYGTEDPEVRDGHALRDFMGYSAFDRQTIISQYDAAMGDGSSGRKTSSLVKFRQKLAGTDRALRRVGR
jgi:hypothetical protein